MGLISWPSHLFHRNNFNFTNRIYLFPECLLSPTETHLKQTLFCFFLFLFLATTIYNVNCINCNFLFKLSLLLGRSCCFCIYIKMQILCTNLHVAPSQTIAVENVRSPSLISFDHNRPKRQWQSFVMNTTSLCASVCV